MGKLLMAQAFSRALLCSERKEGEAEACGHCHSCSQASTLNHPDIIYFRPGDAPKNAVSDYAREKIVGDMYTRPYQSPYKVYIIEHAETLSETVQNILLKSIEEPPAYAIVILLVSNRQMMLRTILSRCVEMPFRPVSEERIANYLKEKYQITDIMAAEHARFSGGNPGKAMRHTEDVSFMERRESVIRLMRDFEDKASYEWMPFIKEAVKDKKLTGEYIDLIEVWMRDVLFYKTDAKKAGLCYDNEKTSIGNMASAMTYEEINRGFRGIETARIHLAQSVDSELVMLNMLDSLLVER